MGKHNNKQHNNTNQDFSMKSLLQINAFKSTRDAEWFKRTISKIDQVKTELDLKFQSEEKRKGKIDFIRKLKTKLKDYKDAKKNQEIYKNIRFFERRKLERQLEKVRKEVEAGKDKEKKLDLLKEKERIEDDINYIKYFPVNYKYYSLFPKKDVDNEETIRKRNKIRNKIKIFLNTKKNRMVRIGNVTSEGKDKSKVKDKGDSVEVYDEIDFSSEDENEKEEDEEKEKEKSEGKASKVSKSSKEKEKEKEKKGILKDYEEENVYKNTIEKDDFFIID